MCGNITEDSLEINVSQFDTYSQEELDEKIASLRLEITQKEKRVQMLGFPGTYKPLEKDMICYPKKAWVALTVTALLTGLGAAATVWGIPDEFLPSVWRGLFGLAELGCGAVAFDQICRYNRQRRGQAQKTWEAANWKAYEIFKIRENERLIYEFNTKERLLQEIRMAYKQLKILEELKKGKNK